MTNNDIIIDDIINDQPILTYGWPVVAKPAMAVMAARPASRLRIRERKPVMTNQPNYDIVIIIIIIIIDDLYLPLR